MIVTCPNCQTRYNLPDDKVPAGGAKVKCSKCSQVFKAEQPPTPPEEEFEALLEEESQGPEGAAEDEFDEAFDDVAAAAGAQADEEESSEEPVSEEPAADESPEDESEEEIFAADSDEDEDLFADEGDEGVEEMDGTDDLFDDAEESMPELEEGAKPAAEPESSASEDDDIFAGIGDDEEDDDLFSDDDDDDLFADDDDADGDGDGESYQEDEDEDGEEFDSFSDDLSLDKGEAPRKKGGKSLGCLIILLVAVLGLGAAIYFKVWTYAGIDLGDSLKNVPFIGQMFMEEDGGSDEAAPGESPAERVRKIELKNVKQYYVANEKLGNLFVVEGKAVNKFAEPKEQIKVEVILYDETNNVLTSQAFLCGNVLSQFQLQVQTEKEISDGLASEVGILSNNTFIRPGASTPFMAVFFEPPAGVKEFMVKVVDVGDPE